MGAVFVWHRFLIAEAGLKPYRNTEGTVPTRA